jgi:S-adenosylmethionine synthetase
MTGVISLSSSGVDPDTQPFEFIERKGVGHPDTLADALAEHLSQTYSRYTLERFGAILRHQFDKIVLMCGRSRVTFGDGEMLSPVRVLLNGRASSRLGTEEIPVRDILISATRDFFSERLPVLDKLNDLRILYEVRTGDNSTTGGIHGNSQDDAASIHFRFNPRTLADLPETHRLQSNDTSLGCGWAPYSRLERLVLAIERGLNAPIDQRRLPYVGSDIKIMAHRRGEQASIVAAVPMLARETVSAHAYFDQVAMVASRIRRIAGATTPDLELVELIVNSGDSITDRKLYMNLTGSSIESGDEGVVGRGNRIGGLIAPARPLTMEGIGGKNPRYHVGKVYCAAAWDIAKRIHQDTSQPVSVFLVNRMAEPLEVPWRAAFESTRPLDLKLVTSHLAAVMGSLDGVTAGIVRGEYPLF